MSRSKGVAEHYDAVPVPSKGRRAVGPAADLKRVHNDFKRSIISEYATKVGFLVDIGCGRGGDLAKWISSGVKHVLGIDVSDAQIEEAEKRRATVGPAGSGYVFEVTDADLGALDDIPDACVDIVTCMFALNYFFGTREDAASLLTNVSRIIRPGGKFVGVFADGRDVAALLRSAPDGGGAYSLYGDDVDAIGRPGFGAGYELRIADTVLDDDGRAPVEFAVHYEELARLARDCGLDPFGSGARKRPALDRIKDENFRRVSRLYSAFAFVKSLREDDTVCDF